MARKLAVGALAAVGLILSGCAGDSPEEARDRYCEALSGLKAELAVFGDLVAENSTVDDLQAQQDAIGDAYQDVADAVADLDDAVSDEVGDARDAFDDAVEDIPGDANAAEGLIAYGAAVQEYVRAVGSSLSQIGCQ